MEEKNIILAKLERLEKISLLSAKSILTIEDVCDLTGLSRARIYTLCSQKEIPHYKQGKTYFKRDEVERWLTAHRVPTSQEIKSKAAMYCHTH